MKPRLDHVAIGAGTLAQGVAWLKDILGVDIPPGGHHAAMSTHNHLMATGGGTYLEVLAIDPDAPPPGRNRWFGLDDPAIADGLTARPRPHAWIVNTDDLDAVIAASPVDLGRAIRLERGNLRWRMAVRDDGALPAGGALPLFIEWPPGVHPAAAMADLGCRLDRVMITDPDPQRLRAWMQDLGLDTLADLSAGPRALRFAMTCPTGPVILA